MWKKRSPVRSVGVLVYILREGRGGEGRGKIGLHTGVPRVEECRDDC